MPKLPMPELSRHTKFQKTKVSDAEIAHSGAFQAYEFPKTKVSDAEIAHSGAFQAYEIPKNKGFRCRKAPVWAISAFSRWLSELPYKESRFNTVLNSIIHIQP